MQLGRADHREWAQGDIRGIGLEDICDTGNQKAANETVIPNALPAFLHVLLARLDAKQPASRRIVVVAVVGGAKVASGREALDILRPAQQAARSEDVRQRPGSHAEDGGCGLVRRSAKPCEVGGLE